MRITRALARRVGNDAVMALHGMDHFRGRVVVTVAAVALELAAMAVLGLTETHHDILGITGALAVLIAVIAAVLAGPLAGCLTALAGGVAFYGFVTDWGETAPLTATIASVVVWSLSALIVGVVADRLRDQEAARQVAEDAATLLHARLETSLLPHLEPEQAGLRLVWRYLPSEDRLGLSGDFYDAARTPEGRLAVVIGDVVGHGPDAAALGATLRAAWHALVTAGVSTQRLVATLDAVLARERRSPDAFATLCLAWFGDDRAGASLLLLGHPPPIIISEGRVEQLKVVPLPPLGLVDTADCRLTEVPLRSAWSLLLYTDGLVEGHFTHDSRERYGVERLLTRLEREVRGCFNECCLHSVLTGVISANGGPLPDDVAILCVSRALDT